MVFKTFLEESNRKLKKIWVDKSCGFYNRLIKSKVKINAIEACHIHNEGNSGVAERSIKILKSKIFKYMTSISKNVYIKKLNDTEQIPHTHRSTITMKPADAKSNTFTNSNNEINNEDAKFKIADIVRISKEKVFVI